jgi:LemA protein
MVLYIIIGIVVLFVLWLLLAYNGLIAARNHADEALSDIDVQTKRRYDLIPNLVESVKGYAKQEASVLEKVTEARTAAMNAGSAGLQQSEQAENMLTGTLKSLFAVAESYPDLKSSDNFQQLSAELADTENKIMAARRFYNKMVQAFNTKLQVIPTNIFAKSMGFTEKEFFVNDEPEAKEAVKVSF